MAQECSGQLQQSGPHEQTAGNGDNKTAEEMVGLKFFLKAFAGSHWFEAMLGDGVRGIGSSR